MKTVLSVLILSLVASFSLQAQNCEYTFSGTLTDEHNGEPLVDAVINVIGSDVEVYSDFYGKFSINNLCAAV